jgi:predicted ABC-type ATPase
VSGDFASILTQILGDSAPLLIVLAGSNGAGKSTFFEVFLRATGVAFVNADEIARSLGVGRAPADRYEPARIADRLRKDLLAQRRAFCMETVLSDPSGEKLAFLRSAQSAGYRVLFVWIRIESVELSIARVMQRVEAGGHDVPDEKLEARFPRTRENAIAALSFADLGLVIDNSDLDRPFRHLQTWVHGKRQ